VKREDFVKSTRRGFISAVAAASAWLSGAFRAGAQTATPVPSPSPTPAAPAPPSLFAQAARERYGKFLTPDEQKSLEERIAGQERRGSRLRSFKLANGEEPVNDFRAVRGARVRGSVPEHRR